MRKRTVILLGVMLVLGAAADGASMVWNSGNRFLGWKAGKNTLVCQAGPNRCA